MLKSVVDEVVSEKLLYSENVVFDTWEELAEERDKSRTY
jgi:hypothetical protein